MDNSFILSLWFDHLHQNNRMLTQSMELVHSNLRLVERNLAEQRSQSLRLLERFLSNSPSPSTTNNTPNTSNTSNTTNASTGVGFPNIFNPSSNLNNTRNNIFRSSPVWRFNPPPPPPPPLVNHPRWASRRRRRNTRISNLIQESISSMGRLPNYRNIPTSLQIHDATTNIKWKDIKESTDQEICPITQQNFEDEDDVLRINHCGHVFKKDSLVTLGLKEVHYVRYADIILL